MLNKGKGSKTSRETLEQIHGQNSHLHALQASKTTGRRKKDRARGSPSEARPGSQPGVKPHILPTATPPLGITMGGT